MFKPTYLYIKTHNITGLKYFGKTTSKDPYKYKGSGSYWKNHIKKHGYDCSTEIIGYYINEKECIEIALNFSKENNIVEDPEWANLKEETGVDGGHPGEFGVNKIKNTKNSEEWKNTKGKCAIEKQKETKNSEEWKNSIGIIQQEKLRKTFNDPIWKNTVGKEKKIKEKNTKSTIEYKNTKGKERNEKDRNRKLSLKWKEEVGNKATEKQKETKNSEEWKNSIGVVSRIKCSQTQKSEEWKLKNWKICEHCNKYVSPGMYKRWHGDNCKSKNI